MAEAKKKATKTTTKAAAKPKKSEVIEQAIVEEAITPTEVVVIDEAIIKDNDKDKVQPGVEVIETLTVTTKAGKRSTKAQREAAEEEERLARKDSGETVEAKPKQPSNPTRSQLERRSKGFRKSAELIEVGKVYELSEAVELAKKTSHVKFDAGVELHINLSVDPRHADQNIRDNLVLPSGTGKKVRVAVLTDDAAEATKAGADVAGNDEVLAQLEKGSMDFDILIATPQLMAKLGKYARMLGPRGLMPNPKSGTVTTDINKAVAEAKAGRVEYRVDSTGIVHLGVGKVSFTKQVLKVATSKLFT
jgi:large subunit ribosomal protein L1